MDLLKSETEFSECRWSALGLWVAVLLTVFLR